MGLRNSSAVSNEAAGLPFAPTTDALHIVLSLPCAFSPLRPSEGLPTRAPHTQPPIPVLISSERHPSLDLNPTTGLEMHREFLP